jgi:hypothetical protein
MSTASIKRFRQRKTSGQRGRGETLKPKKKTPSATGLFARSYTESVDFRPVDMTYLAFLEKSVEEKVVPAMKRIQRRKEHRAARARRLRVD